MPSVTIPTLSWDEDMLLCLRERFALGLLFEHFHHGLGLSASVGLFQVEQGLIHYVHNGSEELMDSVTILASSPELGKQSLPQTLFVTVESVNDKAPVITANKILQVRAVYFWFT